MSSKVVNYCRAIVIVHGKSELMMTQHIKSNLRLNMYIISNKNGRSSIQVNGLLNYINSDSRLKNLSAMQKSFSPEIVKRKIKGCKIFSIMDLDDCDSIEAEKYKSGEMFNNSWLKECIVPVWCEPNFDVAMKKSGLIKTLSSDSQKADTYSRIFRIDHSNETNLGEIEAFRDRLKNIPCTNLGLFVDYCVDIARESL